MESRTRSLPPGGNPFWSVGAMTEWNLRRMRPEELPPVSDGDLDGSRPPVGDRRGRTERPRSPVREAQRPIQHQFETPASWTKSSMDSQREGEGLRSQGAMPSEVLLKNIGAKSEGRIPGTWDCPDPRSAPRSGMQMPEERDQGRVWSTHSQGDSRRAADDELDRAMERTMFEDLRD